MLNVFTRTTKKLLEQRSIVLFLQRKGFTATLIHKELVEVLGSEAVSYSTVTKYLRSELTTPISKVCPKMDEKSGDEIIDDAIISVLADEPYSSVRQIAQRTKIPKSTVFYHLVHSLGFVSKHAKWIPKKLTQEQMQDRVYKCSKLATILRKVFHHNYQFVITLD